MRIRRSIWTSSAVLALLVPPLGAWAQSSTDSLSNPVAPCVGSSSGAGENNVNGGANLGASVGQSPCSPLASPFDAGTPNLGQSTLSPPGSPSLGAQPTAPSMQPTAPGAQPTAPGSQPTAPGAQPTAPGVQPTNPGAPPTNPGTSPSGIQNPSSPGSP